MTLDSLDTKGLQVEQLDLRAHLEILHRGFDTNVQPRDGFYQSIDPAVDESIARTIGIDDTATVAALRPTIMESTRQLLYGIEKNGFHTLGLEEISSWKINPEYAVQNIKQQSGYAAEVVSTWKENMIAQTEGTGIKTVRADDLPELFKRNDQFVDKVRVDANGQIVERIQTKFVGANGKEWVSKMMSKDFDKYFDGSVDKIECPKDYYDDALVAIKDRRATLQQQLERVSADGKTDVVQSLERRIDKLNQLEQMAEKSTVSTDEAVYARMHPKAYAAKMYTSEVAKVSNAEGLKSGALAAGITAVVSTVDNVSSYFEGEITATEMVVDVVEDTAAAGALGYGTAFVSTAVAQTMRASSNQLIQSIGGSCLPAAAVSFAVQSYEDISDYAQGKIDGLELAYNLGGNAAMVAGGIEGAQIGAAIGTVAGPVGTVAGGIVGGVVGCVVATEAYETVVELGSEGAEFLATKANEFANQTIDAVAQSAPEKLEEVKGAFKEFASTVKLPFNI